LVIEVGITNSLIEQERILNAEILHEKRYLLRSSNPNYYKKKAVEAIKNKQYSDAEPYLLNLIKLDPTNGLATSLLAISYNQRNNKKAAFIFEHANKLWPAYTEVRSQSSVYWLNNKDYTKVLQDWNVLLSRMTNTHDMIFPVLANIMLLKESEDVFQQYIDYPPRWWVSYFRFLSMKENNLALIQYLYALRLEGKTGILNHERHFYVDALLKNKQWMLAKDIWLTGLEKDTKYNGDYIFDGGFESNIEKKTFSWHHVIDQKIGKINRGFIPGVSGANALNVNLTKKKPIAFRHVWQRLVLPTGTYKISYRVLLDNLKTNKGLRWRVRCLDDQNVVLGESPVMKGRSFWEKKHFEVKVPEMCKAQILRLEVASFYAHNQTFRGGIWFDDFDIKKTYTDLDE
jgi:tetratricopeptide (TPR) repeat protein